MEVKPQNIRKTITNMEVGDTVVFPVQRMKSVRVQASELGVILERQYKTWTDRYDRTITVERVE